MAGLLTGYTVIQCCNCGVNFGMSDELYEQRRADHKSWFCPNGHGQHFTGKSEADKLREELERTTARLTARLDQAKADADYQKRLAAAAKGAATKMRKRIQAGVCPCCNRHFKDLQRHMETKHTEEK
jgi:hypothetical protein